VTNHLFYYFLEKKLGERSLGEGGGESLGSSTNPDFLIILKPCIGDLGVNNVLLLVNSYIVGEELFFRKVL
jgi:hypothetical protein